MVSFEFDNRAKKIIFLRFLYIGLPLLIISYFGLHFFYIKRKAEIITKVELQQNELTLLYDYQFKNLLASSLDDLKLIRYSDEFSRYIDIPSEETLNDVRGMFHRVLESKPNFLQLRYISEEGYESIRFDRDSYSGIIKENTGLQDKSDRYYFESLSLLGENDFYVSEFDLNVENNRVQIPYTPTIRFGIPVYSDSIRSGFLIINVDGRHILEIFNNFGDFDNESAGIGLLDKNKLIDLRLSDTNALIESSFFRNEEEGSPLYSLLNLDLSSGSFNYNQEKFNYKKILLPADSTHRLVFDKRCDDWYILSNYNELEILHESSFFISRNLVIKIFVLVFEALMTIFVIILMTQKETEHLLLMASGIISDFSHDGVLITNSQKKVIYCNKIFESMFGFKLARIKGKKPKDFLEGDAYPELENSVSDSIAWEGNIWDVTSERVHVQKYLKIRTVSSATKGIAYFIGIYSEPKAIPAIDELYHLEISDTTLPPASLESIENALDENMTDEGQKKMVIALRIKEFMLLKSKISEEEENTLISSLTSQLKQKINAQSVIIAPYSNLLFIAFNLSQSSVEEVMNKIDRAVTSLSFSNRINSIEYISGISLSPDHGTDIKELLEKAYIALEALNRIKKDKYLLFNESIFSEVSKYYQIKNEIENAFKNNEFTVVYQPQNDVATNEITGMEALVRWNSPVLGPVYPSLFIPIMEEDPTQIKRLGKYILKRVMSECKNLLSQVSPQFRISINLSSQEFSDLNIIIDLMYLIGQEAFPKDKICFEITETILSDDLMLTNSIIEELHSNNVTVAIDDFGTGYSSLGYLKRLNSDKLKIDRVFIKDYPEGDDGSILKAIVKLAREMNMKVIVEGVENEIQRNYIEELGCNEYQGYLFSKPVPIDEILKLSGS